MKQSGLTVEIISPNHTDEMASTGDPGPSAGLGAVWSGSMLFALSDYPCKYYYYLLWYIKCTDFVYESDDFCLQNVFMKGHID